MTPRSSACAHGHRYARLTRPIPTSPVARPLTAHAGSRRRHAPLTVLIVVPSLHAGAADAGAVELVRMLARRPAIARSWCRAAAAWWPTSRRRRRVHRDGCREPQSGRHAAQRHGADAARARTRAATWSTRMAARRGWSALLRGAPHRRAVPDQLVQGLPRAERAQAHLQQRDGARRPRDRGQRSDRRSHQRALRHAVGAHRRDSGEHRSSTRFDPARCRPARIEAVRRAWGIRHDVKVDPGRGRMLRRKGHHVVVQAVQPPQGDGAEGFHLRVRRRGSGPHALHRRNCGISCWRPIPPT